MNLSEDMDYCNSILKERVENCWQNLITETVEKKGVVRAFKLIASLYATESNFSAYCHGFTHTLGEKTYFEFVKTGNIELPAETSYCASGFYHGFMEAMLFASGDTEEARTFCSYAEKKLGGDAKGACYHGIGHGLTDGNDPRSWRNPYAMIENSLKLCAQVGENKYYINRCASGVFNSLGIFFDNPNHEQLELTTIRENPYWICQEQEKEYFKIPCYQEMDTTIFRLNNNDIARSIPYAEKIPEDIYAAQAVESLANFSLWGEGFKKFNEIEMINICRNTQERLRIPCIRGIGVGLVEFGPPEREYVPGLQFCQSKNLITEEQRGCMDRVVPYIQILYTKKIFKKNLQYSNS